MSRGTETVPHPARTPAPHPWPGHRRTVRCLLLTAGAANAFGFLALGGVFTSVVTADTALLGLHPGGGTFAAAGPVAVALLGHCAGAAAGSLVSGGRGRLPAGGVRAGLALESTLLWLVAGVSLGRLVPQQATFAPSRRPARTLAAPGTSPSTSSTRTCTRHAESTHRTPLLDGQTLPAGALEQVWVCGVTADAVRLGGPHPGRPRSRTRPGRGARPAPGRTRTAERRPVPGRLAGDTAGRLSSCGSSPAHHGCVPVGRGRSGRRPPAASGAGQRADPADIFAQPRHRTTDLAVDLGNLTACLVPFAGRDQARQAAPGGRRSAGVRGVLNLRALPLRCSGGRFRRRPRVRRNRDGATARVSRPVVPGERKSPATGAE
ncbi:hypothetical protein GCM10010129_78720 [Streptomyces fumigatiscleroticus]|nr:hypothetical protein GCM10010129_78720 [Streptomyces fumigatiscleroticus]